MAEPAVLPELTASTPGALLAMLRLGSAALPIGAFAYSQGLEQAVAAGAVRDAASAAEWITGILASSVLSGDVPVLLRLCAAWQMADENAVRRWSAFLYATRPTRELREEERQLGSALFRLLARLGCERARPYHGDPRATLASAFALAACTWEVGASNGALAYSFAWAEAQVGAATRLVPLGQSDAQRVLSLSIACICREFPEALARSDDAIFHTAPGQALLSAAHETQYSRLFRS
jgi:urease accessory protein